MAIVKKYTGTVEIDNALRSIYTYIDSAVRNGGQAQTQTPNTNPTPNNVQSRANAQVIEKLNSLIGSLANELVRLKNNTEINVVNIETNKEGIQALQEKDKGLITLNDEPLSFNNEYLKE